jgi:hypothetical protein
MSSYNLNPSNFYFKKPTQWKYMPMWEKISYYKNILNENYAPFVDKLTAKSIVKQICGDQIEVANVVRILSSPEDLKQVDLNPNHLIKASHGSGWNINIQPTTNLELCKESLRKWNTKYTGINTGESQYQYLKPQFFIEEKICDIETGYSGEAVVFMFRCINSKVITIGVKKGNVQNSYDVYWNPLEPEEFSIKKPSNINTMLYLAEKLSAPFEFVRVDFFLSADKKIYFSEYTFTPAGGTQIFNSYLEKYFGALWQ